LAAGSDAIVLDVKCGDGAFMENLDDAITLADLMVDIGYDAGRRTVACITDMNQPLGKAVGNALEVQEAIDTLKGRGPEDITELSKKLAGIMIFLGGRAESPEQGYDMARLALEGGMGLTQIRRFIEAQGGNGDIVYDYSLFPQPKFSLELKAMRGGYVKAIKARQIGLASQKTGAGRETKEDEIDLSAGIVLNKKVGDKVAEDEVLATFYGNDLKKVKDGIEEAKSAFEISDEEVERPSLIKEIIGL
ncbi:MAG: pyrimidine-nucleoside phosphorylase, partial [Firmicutes bacterium]|nr:pyrimidine-nucleoside phosphorylase [Bacillota bacterium]